MPINVRYRRAVSARGHFPNEQAALKCLYLATRSLDPTGGGRARWVARCEVRAEHVRDHLHQTVQKNHSLMKTTGPHTPFYRTDPFETFQRTKWLSGRESHKPDPPVLLDPDDAGGVLSTTWQGGIALPPWHEH